MKHNGVLLSRCYKIYEEVSETAEKKIKNQNSALIVLNKIWKYVRNFFKKDCCKN
jgi:hypothetical protein